MKTLKYKIEEFDPILCQLATPWKIFVGLYHATNGNPCETGCGYFNNGKCAGYLMLTTSEAAFNKISRKTNAEIAEELNCSKRQVSKMRKAGLLNN